jgi:transcriptional regulator GlxA family with amidase domain
MGFELMIPSLVFGMANEAAAARRYEVRVCGHRRRAAATADWGGVEFRTCYGLDALADADLVIGPGVHAFLKAPQAQVISAIQGAAEAGARVAVQSGFGSYGSLRHHFQRTVGRSTGTAEDASRSTGSRLRCSA